MPWALLRNQTYVQDRVQNLQIHALRAKILTCFSAAELGWKFKRLIYKQYIETDLGNGVILVISPTIPHLAI